MLLFIGEGFLTTDTLRGILLELEPSLDDAQLQDIIDEVDEDGSGTIDFDGKVFTVQPCESLCETNRFFLDRIHEHDDGLETHFQTKNSLFFFASQIIQEDGKPKNSSRRRLNAARKISSSLF